MAVDAPDNLGLPEAHVRRTLTYVDLRGEIHTIDEAQLPKLELPLVILGEPGMGKTHLLSTLATEPGFNFVTAKALLRRAVDEKNDARGEALVIDALDEVASARADDPIQMILRQLSALGSPPFILSCRSADWRSAIARHDIGEDYGRPPLELRLNPFSEDDAFRWLQHKVGKDRARQTLDGLKQRSLEALYGNPLTLTLIARLAALDGALPDSRAALFSGTCDLLWAEQNPRHQTAALSQLSRGQALGAAGAACAALVLTGSEAISVEVAGQTQDGDLRSVDVAALPDGTVIETVLKSLLFQRPGERDRFTPLHRTIAEYLGAKWLAARVDGATARRLLALLTYNGGVPASLRGLHAWLAHFSRSLAPQVITNDPYGVLRYGDADGLSASEGDAMLDALKALSEEDPYFRSEDWTRHTARGLTHPELADKVKSLVLSPASAPQLRSLLLDALKGSPAAGLLRQALFKMLMTDGDGAFNHSERIGAAEALIGLTGPAEDWPSVVDTLSRRTSADARRLAIDILIAVGIDAFDVEAVVDAVLGYLGRLPGIDASSDAVDQVGPLYFLARRLPAQNLAAVLDRFFERNPGGKAPDWKTDYALNDFINTLIARQLAHEAPEPMRLMGWLRIAAARRSHSGDERQAIGEFIKAHPAYRRTIQEHVLLVETDSDTAWGRIWGLQEADGTLMPDADDVVALLGSSRLLPLTDPAVRDMWKDVVRIAARRDGLPEIVSEVAGAQAAGDSDLLAYLEQLRHPKAPKWEVDQRNRAAAEARRRATSWAKHRQEFLAQEAAIRAGELGQILPLAQAYLGHFNDMDGKATPRERLRAWVGDELLEAALAGFEAVLHRTDLPTSLQIAESYGQSRRWNFISPILVGLLERIATGRALVGVSQDVLLSGRLGCEWEHFSRADEGGELASALDAWLIARPPAFETYARLLVEPQLKLSADAPHINGLYQLTRRTDVAEIVTALAQEWLSSFLDMPAVAETELIEHLARFRAWTALQTAAAARRFLGYRNSEHRLTWLSAEFLADFRNFRGDLDAEAKVNSNLMWHIRRRGGLAHSDPAVGGGLLARASWHIRTFRTSFPATRPPIGGWSGHENAWDATEYLQTAINAIAADTSDSAIATLAELRDEVADGYSNAIRNALAGQVRARRDANFKPAAVSDLQAVLASAAPTTIQDLRAVALDGIDLLQRRVRADDVDSIQLFFDGDKPHTENRCRNVFTTLLRGELPYGIECVPERAMPNGKRADLALQLGSLQLPLEAKGQWNPGLWTAAVEQLDGLYTKEWRASGAGIYLVFWFGPDAPLGRRLRAPPKGLKRPSTPDELAAALSASLPEHRRSDLSIVVFDVSR